MKRKLKFQDYKHFLEAATLIENKINHLAKKYIDADSPEEDKKKIIKNNKLILNTQWKFRIEKPNGFIEEINKITLGSNDYKEYS